jgi:hypothetical protein
MWPEVIREVRWFAHSRAALALILMSAVMALWAAISGATSAVAAVSTFRETLSRYQAHGEDVANALRSPATVSGGGAEQIIDNPLRHDLDQAVLAFTQLQPAGAMSAALSLGALIAFPVIAFALGVFVATHDLKSGSIIARWPSSGLVRFAASKPIALIAAMTAMTIVTGLLSVPLTWAAGLLVSAETADLRAFAATGPDLGQTARIALLAVLGSATGAAFGLLIGAATRNRSVTIAVFSVAYLLVPLLGPGDPRNLLAQAGATAFYFPGQFHPVPLGGISSLSAAWMLVAIALACTCASALPWAWRARAERVA